MIGAQKCILIARLSNIVFENNVSFVAEYWSFTPMNSNYVMTGSYWLDRFTGTMWKKFLQAGANVPVFSNRPGGADGLIWVFDVLTCYLVSITRWVSSFIFGFNNDVHRVRHNVRYVQELCLNITKWSLGR